MPSFLTDADVWICVCYTSLATLSAKHGDQALDGTTCDGLARALYGDAAYQCLDPSLAAEAYLHAKTAPAER